MGPPSQQRWDGMGNEEVEDCCYECGESWDGIECWPVAGVGYVRRAVGCAWWVEAFEGELIKTCTATAQDKLDICMAMHLQCTHLDGINKRDQRLGSQPTSPVRSLV